MKKDEQMLPVTDDVIERVEALKVEIHKALEKEDLEQADILNEEYEDVMSSYDFYDQIFEENGKKGLKDVMGNLLVPALYSDFYEVFRIDFNRAYPVVAADESGKLAMVTTDGKGTPLMPFEYDVIEFIDFSDYFVAEKSGKYGVLTSDAEFIVPCELDRCYEPVGDIMTVEADGRFGLLTSWGLYVKPIFDEMTDKEDCIYVRKGKDWGFLDEDGRFIPEKDKAAVEGADLLSYIYE